MGYENGSRKDLGGSILPEGGGWRCARRRKVGWPLCEGPTLFRGLFADPGDSCLASRVREYAALNTTGVRVIIAPLSHQEIVTYPTHDSSLLRA